MQKMLFSLSLVFLIAGAFGAGMLVQSQLRVEDPPMLTHEKTKTELHQLREEVQQLRPFLKELDQAKSEIKELQQAKTEIQILKTEWDELKSKTAQVTARQRAFTASATVTALLASKPGPILAVSFLNGITRNSGIAKERSKGSGNVDSLFPPLKLQPGNPDTQSPVPDTRFLE